MVVCFLFFLFSWGFLEAAFASFWNKFIFSVTFSIGKMLWLRELLSEELSCLECENEKSLPGWRAGAGGSSQGDTEMVQGRRVQCVSMERALTSPSNLKLFNQGGSWHLLTSSWTDLLLDGAPVGGCQQDSHLVLSTLLLLASKNK